MVKINLTKLAFCVRLRLGSGPGSQIQDPLSLNVSSLHLIQLVEELQVVQFYPHLRQEPPSKSQYEAVSIYLSLLPNKIFECEFIISKFSRSYFDE